jgi:hypothetical protein
MDNHQHQAMENKIQHVDIDHVRVQFVQEIVPLMDLFL